MVFPSLRHLCAELHAKRKLRQTSKVLRLPRANRKWRWETSRDVDVYCSREGGGRRFVCAIRRNVAIDLPPYPLTLTYTLRSARHFLPTVGRVRGPVRSGQLRRLERTNSLLKNSFGEFAQQSAARRCCYRKTQEERASGYHGSEMTHAQMVKACGTRVRPMPRFGVVQNGKLRNIDDAKSAMINAATNADGRGGRLDGVDAANGPGSPLAGPPRPTLPLIPSSPGGAGRRGEHLPSILFPPGGE